MSPTSIGMIEDRLQTRVVVPEEMKPNARQAAVAAVLRADGEDTEVLFIQRSKKQGDPWSGHMAFPGGHREAIDTSLQETAVRETLEEVGLDLTTSGRYMGQLEMVRANPRGRNIDMTVSPFVFELTNAHPTLSLNHEVAEVHWGRLGEMMRGDVYADDAWKGPPGAKAFPGHHVGGQVVWGLTFRMLEDLFALLTPGFERRG